MIILDKVFQSGLCKFCGRQTFKGCLPQNLVSPLFNTLPHMISFQRHNQNPVKHLRWMFYIKVVNDKCSSLFSQNTSQAPTYAIHFSRNN